MVIYYAPAELMAQMANATPEQAAEGMKPWLAWKEKLGEKLVDLGAPLVGGVKVLPDGSGESSQKEVSGFSILQAENIDEAKSLLIDHPHSAWSGGCDIEVHEFAQM